MQKSWFRTTRYASAVLLITSSIALAFYQVMDIDTIAHGTLMYIAQAFLLAGSIFGLEYYVKKLTSIITDEKSKKDAAALVLLLLISVPSFAQISIIDNGEFRSAYDTTTRCPSLVTWSLSKTDLGSAKRSANWHFQSDVVMDSIVPCHEDFLHSGYHRGHLCPAADRSKTTARMLATFVMSNVAPQTPALNTGNWLATERWCRKYVAGHDSLRVLVVPVFLDRDTTFIGQSRLAVPHAFFKSAWDAKTDSVVNCWFIFNK